MINFSHRWIDQVENAFNRSHSGNQVRDFVVINYGRVVKELGDVADPKKAEIAQDLWQIHEKMLVLGWVQTKKNPFNNHHPVKKILQIDLRAWEKGLREGKVIHAGIVKAGAGFYLDQFAIQKKALNESFVADNLEQLLKHVETRREKCLLKFDPIAEEKSLWFERLNIVLLFIRTSHRKKDPRFLNAALKLNDWYFSHFQSQTDIPDMVRFLLVLVEQELAFKELFP